MNDDLVAQKILKLLENNTAFIGYALNGGIGTKINVRNTETGKTIQALSINVDSTGEVLVVKDSEDNQYKAVTFKTAEKVSEKIIQLRKTKPIDDKKTIEYTDSNIEVFYLFVKLIDTGSPVPTQLTSTWIRKGSSCTQFVGAYERCNYASKATINGVSYTGLPYIEYPTLEACLNDDLGRDAKTPHGSKDEQGAGFGSKIFSTMMTAQAEQNLLAALESHDANYNTNYKKLFGYGSILECSGGMYVQGWEIAQNSQTGQNFFQCDFSFLPGFTVDCTPAMQAAGYCDTRGYISSKAPLFGQEEPGQPSVGNVDNTWGHQYGWKDLPYEFMYKRHFIPLYVNGQAAQGSFYILEVNDDQIPSQLPPDYFPWVPGCPANGQGGPYDGSGGNRFPDGVPPIQKRDMKLSTHKAEIWLGSSKKTEAIKLYELGASDLFSGMYNSFIVKADETIKELKIRINSVSPITTQENLIHETFYKNWNKNIIDQRIDPRMWVYVIDNTPKVQSFNDDLSGVPSNKSLALMLHHIYMKTINLTVVDNKTQIIHLKLGLTPSNILSNTDCKGIVNGSSSSPKDYLSAQSWQYQRFVTIKVNNWEIESTVNTLNTTNIEDCWNKDYLDRTYLTIFQKALNINSNYQDYRNRAGLLLLCSTNDTSLSELYSGNHFEQFNYSLAEIGLDPNEPSNPKNNLFLDYDKSMNNAPYTNALGARYIGYSTISWWELWSKTHYSQKNKRLSAVVGYDINYDEINRDWGLDISFKWEFGIHFTFFKYIERPTRYLLPSIIRRARSGNLPANTGLGQAYSYIKDRKEVLKRTGHNFYFADGKTPWSRTYALSNTGQSELPTYTYSDKVYPLLDSYFTYSLHNSPMNLSQSGSTGSYRGDYALMEPMDWKNKLWAQIIYMGETKVDVDSYKNVNFTLPSDPSKYIKLVTSSMYADEEFNFIENTTQPKKILETVLSPGVLDVTKQVPIKKPTNVDLDPNMSFLVYLYPFCTVTKKTKKI